MHAKEKVKGDRDGFGNIKPNDQGRQLALPINQCKNGSFLLNKLPSFSRYSMLV